MSNDSYRNKKIEALSPLVGAPFSCCVAAEGLPNSILNMEPVLFSLAPKIAMRLVVSPHGDTRRLDDFLQNEIGLTKGVDYEQHANGYRGGMLYFDFGSPEIAEKLEAYSKSKGLEAEKPREYMKVQPLPWRQGGDKSRS